MPIEKGDAGIIIIFLVIGITSIVMFLVYFHLRKSRQASRTAEEVVAIEQRRRRAYLRRLRERYEREVSAVSGNSAEPPSYVVTVDNDLRPPPPSYQDHRRDTRIT
ncbi:hypothetical protein BJV82DRAFT_715471 [Fennellomyces sp. T-0311]|nr:hypothetical protein BJV82DRAFT_715471 [Fennellomyces sp. T-0311]